MFLTLYQNCIDNSETSAPDRRREIKHTLRELFTLFFFLSSAGDCRQLVFPSYLIRIGNRLFGHNVTIMLVRDIDECEWHCYQHPCCVSINFRTIANTKKLHRCELNNATSKKDENNLVPQKGFIYHEAEVSAKVRYNYLFSFPIDNPGTSSFSKSSERKDTATSGELTIAYQCSRQRNKTNVHRNQWQGVHPSPSKKNCIEALVLRRRSKFHKKIITAR